MAALELQYSILKNSANLKAYYRFESGVETTDSSGTGNTLTAIGTPTYSAGKFGQSVNLATDKAFSITDGATVKPTGSFSVGLWFKVSSSLTFYQLFQSYSTNNGIRVDMGAIAHKARLVINAGSTVLDGVITIDDGNWHLLVATWDGATYRMFIDSKQDVSSASTTAPTYGGTNYVRIGCLNSSGSNGSFLSGSLDDVFLLNGTALSADQIKELYEGRLVGEGWPQTGLQNLYHLNSGLLTDYSGNNRHLTLNGTVTNPEGKFGNCASATWNNSNKLTGSTVSIGTGDFTIGCWFKKSTPSTLDYTPTFMMVGSLAIGLARMYLISGKTTGYFGCYTFDGASTNVDTTKNICDNVWHYVVGIRSGTNMYNYVDGAQLGTVSGTARNINATDFVIGHQNNATNDFIGDAMIDEVFFYNVAKDAKWVRTQYGVGRGKWY